MPGAGELELRLALTAADDLGDGLGEPNGLAMEASRSRPK